MVGFGHLVGTGIAPVSKKTAVKGPFNNYVDKMKVGGGKNVCPCPRLRYKTVHSGGPGGGGVKK